MSGLRFEFRRQPVQEQWRGRWLRGIELEQQRIEQRAAEQRARRDRATIEHDEHREPSSRLLQAWAPVEAELRASVDELTFKIWLSQNGQAALHPHALVGGVWRLAAHERSVAWVRDRFGRLIEACAQRPVCFVACDCDRRSEAA